MQHCVILTMGDPAKEEAHRFYNELLAPHIPDHLQSKISFDKLYPVFGGKLAHLSDYGALRSALLNPPRLTCSPSYPQWPSSSTLKALCLVRPFPCCRQAVHG